MYQSTILWKTDRDIRHTFKIFKLNSMMNNHVESIQYSNCPPTLNFKMLMWEIPDISVYPQESRNKFPTATDSLNVKTGHIL